MELEWSWSGVEWSWSGVGGRWADGSDRDPAPEELREVHSACAQLASVRLPHVHVPQLVPSRHGPLHFIIIIIIIISSSSIIIIVLIISSSSIIIIIKSMSST